MTMLNGKAKSIQGLKILPVIALLVAIPFALNNYWMSLAVSGALLALAAMPLTVLTGTAGLLSLGQAAFLGIGGYTAGLLAHQFGIGLTVSLFAAAFIGLVVGLVVALATLRVIGLYLAIGTFALQFILQPLMQNMDVSLTQSTGFILSAPQLFGIPLNSMLRWWYALLLIGTLIFAWLRWLQITQIGRNWVMLRDNPTAAGVLGISREKARLGIFATTSAITAAVGALGAYYYGNAQSGAYSLHIAILFLSIVALGGPGSLGGSVIAAFIMITLSPIIEKLISLGNWLDVTRIGGLETIAVGLILMASLIVRARLAQRRHDHGE
ncbi:branched-chain amino acid ABC transporter permease [Ochrobactrum teleogrylli]|uniref:branched-chain amino acid ABC transporter permease n=1 Tax=Ochrobactrum teleogrylli TaxID=2479765 RepID=UPI00384C808E